MGHEFYGTLKYRGKIFFYEKMCLGNDRTSKLKKKSLNPLSCINMQMRTESPLGLKRFY